MPEEPSLAAVQRWAATLVSPRPRLATNLPLHLPPILGRGDDLARVRALIVEHALVTLVGAGGIGKTRLAQAIAHEMRDRYADGVWVVELAPLSSLPMALGAVAQALNISVTMNRPAQDVLVEVLRDQSLLLVLDNCEHLLEPVAGFVEALLDSAPGVAVLATSQEPLKLAKEHQYRVGSLSVPADASLATAADHGAVALFVDRARAVDPRFELAPDNVDAVVDICRRLDGIPLAIELAAARVPLLGVNRLREKLSERFRVLTAGSRFAIPRHQTLHGTLDWSFGLLSPPLQKVFTRLGVFVGGFSLEAAQALVAGDAGLDEWTVLDHLGALVDKSLVAVDAGEPPRYRLLESMRVYALEQLEASGELAATRDRHAAVMYDHFVRIGEDYHGEDGTLSTDDYLRQLYPDLENARIAIDWLVERDLDRAVTIAAVSSEVLNQLGFAPDALRALLPLRERIDAVRDPQVRAYYFEALGFLGRDGRLDFQTARSAFASAEEIYRAHGRPRMLFRALAGHAWASSHSGRTDEAKAMLAELIAMEQPSWPGWLKAYRYNLQARLCDGMRAHAEALRVYAEWQAMLPEHGEERSRLTAMTNQANALNCLRKHAQAIAVARAVIERCREQRLQTTVFSFACLHVMVGLTALDLLDEARAALAHAIPFWRRAGLVVFFGEHIALLAAKQGRLEDAARIAGANAAYCKRKGIITRGRNVERAWEELRAWFDQSGMSAGETERLMKQGEALDLDAIVALALADAPGAAGSPGSPGSASRRTA